MEGIHGVDTSWLHHSRGYRAPRAHQTGHITPPDDDLLEKPVKDEETDIAFSEKPWQNGVNGMSEPAEQLGGQTPYHEHHLLHRPHIPTHKSSERNGLGRSTSPPEAVKEGTKTPPRSPSLSRKSSWMSSLTSKFSSSTPQNQNQNVPIATGKNQQQSQPQNVQSATNSKGEAAALSASPKSSGSGFLSNALRRFSSSTGSQTTKVVPNGGICPRKVLNVDVHRERCQIPDMHPAKLRRVAFCVDVEIAAAPKYKEEAIDESFTPAMPAPSARRRAGSASEREKKNKAKSKERSEGEALKHPNAMAEKKEKSKSLVSEKDIFEVPDVDESPPKTSKPSKPASAIRKDPSPSPNATTTSDMNPEIKSPGLKSPSIKTPPIHHDFGPNGMFEVDEWDEAPIAKSKVKERRGSTGGGVHHDFGRHGMFEIPSDDENGARPASNALRSPRSIARKIGKVPVGHIFSEELMFEIPELQDAKTRAEVVEESQNFPEAKPVPPPKTAGTDQQSNGTNTDPADVNGSTQTSSPATEDGAPTGKEMTRKKEKKKRSEEERKERKEKKRQAAIADGTIPVELVGDDATVQPSNKPSKPQSRPTTDPLRIYKRCCQLRETTPLPTLVDQLSAPSACDPLNPAVVLSVNLSGQTIQLQDVVTLGDWLAVVPVQKLILDYCGLTDEAVRMVLAGLLAAKTTEQAKHNKHLSKKPNKEKKERLGVISKLSLKGNTMIGKNGWLHLGLFVNMSKSLKAIDLSEIPFPRPPQTPAKTSSVGGHSTNSRTSSLESIPIDSMDVFWKCMAERVSNDALEEVVIGDCNFSADHVEKLVDAVIACKVSRLGLAKNNLETRAYHAIARYLNDKVCMGLDLGGNRFAGMEDLQIILNAIDYPDNQMYALSLADCNLTPSDLKFILPIVARLPAFRFIDFSHNHKLFESSPTVLGALSRYLPQMKMLKRLGLNDVAMRSEHAISLAEICPEMPVLAHLSIAENPALTALANAKDEAAQEEACALYASLMAAIRVSKTIVCIDIDVPSKDNSEVVKALAKQVVAYSLRNMESNEHYKVAAAELTGPHGGEQAVAVPDVLLHLVGHVDNLGDTAEDETPAPDQDYLVGGTGVVKALSVVLGQKGRESRRLSREITPATSGTNSPRLGPDAKGRAKDMSRNLLDSARKIRQRLQPALVRASVDAPEEENSKRLGYLDATLARMIGRFEDEYPETRQVQTPRARSDTTTSMTPGPVSSSSFTNPFDATHEAIHSEADLAGDEGLGSLMRASRHGSDVSLASRQLVNEEGRLHRFGQRVKRELMPPTYTEDHHWQTTGSGEEPTHIEMLRAQLENMSGDEIKAEVEKKGLEQVVQEYKVTVEGLRQLEKSDPATWKKCSDAGMCIKVEDDARKVVHADDFANGDAATHSGNADL